MNKMMTYEFIIHVEIKRNERGKSIFSDTVHKLLLFLENINQNISILNINKKLYIFMTFIFFLL